MTDVLTPRQKNVRSDAVDLIGVIGAQADAVRQLDVSVGVFEGSGNTAIGVSASCPNSHVANNSSSVIVLKHGGEIFCGRCSVVVHQNDEWKTVCTLCVAKVQKIE